VRTSAISRIAVLKHIRVLEGAGLLISEKQGRERRLRFNVLPIQMIHDRWSDEYSGFWAGALADLKYRMETEAGAGETRPHDAEGDRSMSVERTVEGDRAVFRVHINGSRQAVWDEMTRPTGPSPRSSTM
jgi:DNA-binding transcriptional ArsR family regulator